MAEQSKASGIFAHPSQGAGLRPLKVGKLCDRTRPQFPRPLGGVWETGVFRNLSVWEHVAWSKTAGSAILPFGKQKGLAGGRVCSAENTSQRNLSPLLVPSWQLTL